MSTMKKTMSLLLALALVFALAACGGTTTIVDVGFNHPDCEQALDDALAALGRSWDKVQVVLTHSHPDHTGNLDRIWREGMPVLANLHSFQEVKNLMEIEDNVYGPLLLQAATLEQQRDLTFDEKGRGCTCRRSFCRFPPTRS